MNRRTVLFIVMTALMAIPAFSQSREADILSFIANTETMVSSVSGNQAHEYTSENEIAEVLAEIAVSGNGRNGVISASRPSDVLDFISSAYTGNSFYNSGSIIGNEYGMFGRSMQTPRILPYDAVNRGRITSGFGFRPHFHRVHKGIDIAMAVGDTVVAAMSGRVDRINYEPGGYGHYVVITHDNGMETRYAHLSSTLVVPGQYVSARQAIALSGNSGNSTGPHLHFEIRRYGEALDPLAVFDFSRGRMKGMYASEEKSLLNKGFIATGFNASEKSLKGKSTYIVRPGDTVKKIASRAGITSLRLCQLNFITENEKLTSGRMLKLR